ncbi:LlsX family protein [Lactiplantibacillus songbeiensis]|uniref:LlsX family protein n=1 Tax=Lactiplantibacillus songbeiensis TaxID=2559920 RepID=A0ABW4C2U7_9LACO|nr:LlsX family protein [Lactiplantibacillus songbeiensis]
MTHRWLRLSIELLAGIPVAMMIIFIGVVVGYFLTHLLPATHFNLRVLGLSVYQISRQGRSIRGQLNAKSAQELSLFCSLAIVLVSESCYTIWHPRIQHKF